MSRVRVDITTSVESLPKLRVSAWHINSKRCPRTSELSRMKTMDRRWRMAKALCLLSTWCSNRAWAPTPPPLASPSRPSSRSSPAMPPTGLCSLVLRLLYDYSSEERVGEYFWRVLLCQELFTEDRKSFTREMTLWVDL